MLCLLARWCSQAYCHSLRKTAYLRRVFDDDLTKAETARLADGSQAALQAGGEELLAHSAVHGVQLGEWGPVPDDLEGYVGELAAPAERQGDATEDAEEVVAASLGAVEAAVGALPYTVDGVSALWLSKNILECHL